MTDATISHTAIRVSDLAVTKRFYGDVLGLTESREVVLEDGTVNWFARDGDNREIQFISHPEQDEDVSQQGIDHLAFGVDDLDALVEALDRDSYGAVDTEPFTVQHEDSPVRIAFGLDPDGYRVELVEETE